MNQSPQLNELRERCVGDLRVLQRIGGDELIVGILGSLIRLDTRPLKHGRAKFQGTFRAGVVAEPPPPPTRRQLRAEARRLRELQSGYDHGLPGG